MQARMLFLLMATLAFGCKPPVQEHQPPDPDPIRDQFVKINRYMHRRHQDHIAAFVERVGWKADVTPSGLWIVKKASGTGPVIAAGNRVTFTFTSTLLDGTPAYRATETAPKEVVIGQGGVESGVEEGMRHLQTGSIATLIIPPHLAHGNFGDRDKIPGNTVLIYHLEIKDVR
ncbi:MAG: FKBP-type peptidyl-prolyl cis-trans isomerase [Bacteroidota bacterium]